MWLLNSHGRLFYRQKTKGWQLAAPLPHLSLWRSISWEPGQTHYPLRKPLHAVSSYSWDLSCLSFYFLSPGSRHGSALCSLARCLFGLLVWDRLSWETLTDSRTVISPPLHSQPTACLRLPACLALLSTHKGLSTLNYFGHKVTGNQWREVFFSLKEGGRAEKFLQKPCKVF